MASRTNLRIAKILDILKKTYPNAKIVLNYSNNWELLVSVILSAQCTDIKVNEVTSKLFEKYKNLSLRAKRGNLQPKQIPTPRQTGLGMTEKQQEINNFASVPLSELEQDIKPTGFYHNKAKNIQNSARMILEKFNGKVPDTMQEILKLPGVARKTANVVLGNAYGIIKGIAIDTHVLRISQRPRLIPLDKIGPNKIPVYFSPTIIGSIAHKQILSQLDYYKDAKPEKIEQELMKVIPKRDWFKFTYQIIDHGRAICKAQNPKCKICPLNKLCPVSRI